MDRETYDKIISEYPVGDTLCAKRLAYNMEQALIFIEKLKSQNKALEEEHTEFRKCLREIVRITDRKHATWKWAHELLNKTKEG